jgi:hypothetical protein
MLSLPASRRTAVERLLFAGLIQVGALLWERVVVTDSASTAAFQQLLARDKIAVAERARTGNDWSDLSDDLSSLAAPGVSRNVPGGR